MFLRFSKIWISNVVKMFLASTVWPFSEPEPNPNPNSEPNPNSVSNPNPGTSDLGRPGTRGPGDPGSVTCNKNQTYVNKNT